MIVAIHQPNYLPWLGYFAKMARADIFVFLDDVQFSKGSYSNRSRIAGPDEPRWLTVPVSCKLGDALDTIRIPDPHWARSHRDRLKQVYRDAESFSAVWPELDNWLQELPADRLVDVNTFLIGKIAARMALPSQLVFSSKLQLPSSSSDVRLSHIVHHLAPGGIYLSGSGGASYQNETTFAERGITLKYTDFTETPYARGSSDFLPGLSILDALFHVGWDTTAEIVRSIK